MRQISVTEGIDLLTGLVAREHWDEAESLARQLLKHVPKHSAVLVALATVLEKTGRYDEAVLHCDHAIAAHPGAGAPFTRRALILLRRQWGPPLQPRPRADGERVASALLGTNGRFGNQLLQYALTKLYAQDHGLQAEFPDWLGRDLFDLDDPLPGAPLPPLEEGPVDIMGAFAGRNAQSLAGHDLRGYFCGASADFAPFRNKFRALFRPGARLAERIRAWETKFAPQSLVALHLRRGDFGTGPHWIAPEEWYLNWVHEIWPTLPSPRLYIATDDAAVLDAFKAFAPLTAADIGEPLPGAEFYIDFHVLTRARKVAISNSTFSFVAAMLNPSADTFVRPEKQTRTLIPFDPWNAPILLRYAD